MDLTYREFSSYARGVQRRDLEDWRRASYAAWYAAAFQRQKRLPDLDKVMEPFNRAIARKPVRLTPEQLLAKVVAINKQFGGKPLSERKKK